MASAAQITANRANAQHSTGPRTPEGKAKSARNRASHGLSSREFVILPHQEAEFEEFISGLQESIQPCGALEHDLFTQFAHAAWNLRRCRLAERELQDSHTPGADPLLDAHVSDRLRLIDLYLRRSERTYHRLLKELKSLQTNRQYRTDLLLAAGDETGDVAPAPLATHLALDRFRTRVYSQAAEREARRCASEALSSLDLSDMLSTIPDLPQSPAFRPEHSNPMHAAPSAAAAR